MSDLCRTLLIAKEAREFLEPQWESWRREKGNAISGAGPLSSDMCRFSARFLCAVLKQEMPEGEWLCLGGSPTLDDDVDPDYGIPGGYKDLSGAWHGHYWVSDGDYGLIVDVTADQFGGEKVFVGEEDFSSSADRIANCRYRENYSEMAVEQHILDVAWRVDLWLSEWRNEHPVGWSDGFLTTPVI